MVKYSVHYSVPFLLIYYRPYSSWILCISFCKFFLQVYPLVNSWEVLGIYCKFLSEKWSIYYVMLCCLLRMCTIKSCLKTTSVIKVATIECRLVTQLFQVKEHLCYQGSHYENTHDFLYAKGAIMCNYQIDNLLSAKMTGTQRRTLVSWWRMYCASCGNLKGTYWAKVTLNTSL